MHTIHKIVQQDDTPDYFSRNKRAVEGSCGRIPVLMEDKKTRQIKRYLVTESVVLTEMVTNKENLIWIVIYEDLSGTLYRDSTAIRCPAILLKL